MRHEEDTEESDESTSTESENTYQLVRDRQIRPPPKLGYADLIAYAMSILRMNVKNQKHIKNL